MTKNGDDASSYVTFVTQGRGAREPSNSRCDSEGCEG